MNDGEVREYIYRAMVPQGFFRAPRQSEISI